VSTSLRKLFPAIWTFAVVLIAAATLVGVRAGLGTTHPSPKTTGRNHAASLRPASTAEGAKVRATLAGLPLAFEANQGQADPHVEFIARGDQYTLLLAKNDAVFSLRAANSSDSKSTRQDFAHPKKSLGQHNNDLLRIKLVGGNPSPASEPIAALPGKTNYFIGNDPNRWHTDVPTFGRVLYHDVYPGVNMAFYGVQRQVEFDFIVAPGANAGNIQLKASDARVTQDDSGNLTLSSSAGKMLLRKPVAYQESNGQRENVEARFALTASNQIFFELGAYDHNRELIIDPAVVYATYLGGTAEDDGYAVAVDNSGNAYVTGQTKSTNFPTVAGGQSGSNGGGFDVFVTKLSPDGSSLVYSTYVGGNGDDSGNAIAVDGSGDAFVAGGTTSTNFPSNGGVQTTSGGSLDAFVFELNFTGSALTYSTYLGGTGSDVAQGIAVDTSGAYVVGLTTSTNFPVHSPIQASIAGLSNGFVTKLNSSGNAFVYSTYLGGGTGDGALAVAVNSNQAYVTGYTQNPTFPTTAGAFQTTCGTGSNCNGALDDAFVSVIKADGSGFVYSTFLGGEDSDQGLGIAADSAGSAYVTGFTASSAHFPLKNPIQATYGGAPEDAFVSVLNPTGSALVYSTYLGGNLNDTATAIAIDSSKNVYVTGQTGSSNFPKANATQTSSGGNNDAFVTEINAAGTQFVFSTYLGGNQNEDSVASGGNVGAFGGIAVDTAGANVYVAGTTSSTNFPTASPEQAASGGGSDAFVARYVLIPDFSISGTALSSVTQGGSSTSTITVTPLNGYAGTVNFTCSVASVSGGTPLPTCSIPNPVTGSGTSTLMVNTTGAAGAANQRSNSIFYATWIPILGLALTGMRLSARRPLHKKLLGFFLLGSVMTVLFLLPGCGGSGGGGGGGGCSGCTPKGSYSVTVTGTDSANANLTSQVKLPLSVN